jgi:hypothetical protein
LFEDCVEDSPLRHELTHERIQAVDGWISVPDRPGLGVTLNEDFVAAHLVAESGREARPSGNGKRHPPHLLRQPLAVEFGAT